MLCPDIRMLLASSLTDLEFTACASTEQWRQNHQRGFAAQKQEISSHLSLESLPASAV